MKYKILFLFIFGWLFSACGPNALSGLGSNSSDEYLIEEATKANNNQNYDYAIDILLYKISSGMQSTAQAKELLASAYAGKCGFNFVNYTTKLSQSSSGSAFRVSMTPFVGVSTTPSYCLAALQTMDTIGTPGQRTANQNTFAAIAGLVMMGASLRTYADISPAIGDGTVDVNLCTGVTNNQMDDIIVGYGYFATNFAFVSAALVGSSSFTSLSNAVNICNSVSGATCTVTNKSSITSGTRNTIRDIVNTVEYGIGSYVSNNDVNNIPPSCP